SEAGGRKGRQGARLSARLAWRQSRSLQDSRRCQTESVHLFAERSSGVGQASGDRVLFWWWLAKRISGTVSASVRVPCVAGHGGDYGRLSSRQPPRRKGRRLR